MINYKGEEGKVSVKGKERVELKRLRRRRSSRRRRRGSGEDKREPMKNERIGKMKLQKARGNRGHVSRETRGCAGGEGGERPSIKRGRDQGTITGRAASNRVYWNRTQMMDHDACAHTNTTHTHTTL